MLTQQVIIIGAPRSGTNMLRDVLCSFEGVATWPCDEINYLWRHGNVRYPSDEIPVSRASSKVKKYIQRQFQWVSKKYHAHTVIEKTCANSLRVPFIDAVIPDAKYIFIHRDGIDATGSAKLRWTAKLDIPYLIEKARFVPLIDLPYYAVGYLWNRLYMLLSSEKRLAFWGPALTDIDTILAKHSLNEVCALQWQQCVEKAEQAFANMPQDKVIKVSYEKFVSEPEKELSRLTEFLGLNVDNDTLRQSVSGVSQKSVGKGRSALSDDEVAHLESLVGRTLQRYGYKS